ncbi:MAG: hypothetical protein E7564_01560 [Ruminococcaceae bacterium]|nr:hypothetical protein [Oscillospiraceae bacterium]
MKNKQNIFIVFEVLALLLLILCFMPHGEERLSEEEIESLRTKYVLYDQENPLVEFTSEYYNKTIRDYVKNNHTFVYCEVLRDAYEELSGLDRITYVKVKVISDTEGFFEEGDEFAFRYGIMDSYYSPQPKKGDRIVVPVGFSIYNKIFDIYGDRNGCYYVTEDDFVISAFFERGDIKYSGIKIDSLMKKLKKTYLESTEYLKLMKEEYNHSSGRRGFENLNEYKKLIRSKITE